MTGSDRTLSEERPVPPSPRPSTDASATPTPPFERGEGTSTGTASDDTGVDVARLRASLPAIATDIGMGLLFFVVARFEGLRTAALVSAGTGIALVPIQWGIRRVTGKRIDLFGGMALFGMGMLAISAAFSWWVQSDIAIQLKGTVIGGVVAIAYAIDAIFRGRWLARRLTMYLAYTDLDQRRLAIGMSGVGAALAALNTAFALGMSREVWLMYSAWGDTIASMVLAGIAVQLARRPVATEGAGLS